MDTVNNGFLFPMKMWLVVEPIHNSCRLWLGGWAPTATIDIFGMGWNNKFFQWGVGENYHPTLWDLPQKRPTKKKNHQFHLTKLSHCESKMHDVWDSPCLKRCDPLVFFGEILMATSLAGWQVLFLLPFQATCWWLLFFHNKWWIHIADGFLNGVK